jgi:phosphoglycolate phosphatase-like HAD superfamily hydrolase
VSDVPLLLLWDIDGTLLQRASTEHAEALRRALREVHGDHLGLEQVQGVQAAGRTDGAIARDLLLACGVEAAAIDAEVRAVQRAACRAYEDLCPSDLSAKVAPGIPELLAALAADARFRLSLVTGNFEPVARLKLERAGIGHHFEPGQGGFGTDAEAREELPPIARARAGADGTPWPRERTLVIGDTPNDIACARHFGARAVAVATGRGYTAADLAPHAPDALLPDLKDTELLLRTLSGF